MTLKAAVREHLHNNGVFTRDSIFYGLAHSNQDKVLVLRDLPEHRFESSRFRLFPALSLYLRDTSENYTTVEALAWTLFRLYDIKGPLALTDTYKVSHVEPAGHPIDLGQDQAGNWARSLTLHFAVSPTQTI